MRQDPNAYQQYPPEDIIEQEDSMNASTALLDQMGQHESIKFILDSSNILRMIEKRLDKLKTKYSKIKGIDREGVKQIGDLKEEILLLLEPITSRAIYLSDLEEEHVYTISYEANKAIIKEVFEKGDVITHADKKVIIALCYAVIFASLRRPYRGGERTLLSKTQQAKEIIQKVAGRTQQKGGWRSLFAKF